MSKIYDYSESGIRHLMKEIRDKGRHTQEGLARRLNVSTTAVRGWEYGRSFPHMNYWQSLILIAKEAGIELTAHALLDIKMSK